jgi:hypothetical protein
VDQARYQNTQSLLLALSAVLLRLPLAEFSAALDHAHSVGPIADPTLYRDALNSGNLDYIGSIANALIKARTEIHSALGRHPKGAEPLQKLLTETCKSADGVVFLKLSEAAQVALTIAAAHGGVE